MTKVTVTIDTKSNARLFLEMVKALNFVKDVKSENIYDDDLTKEEISLLEDRWADYIKNPQAVQTWNEVKTELAEKKVY